MKVTNRAGVTFGKITTTPSRWYVITDIHCDAILARAKGYEPALQDMRCLYGDEVWEYLNSSPEHLLHCYYKYMLFNYHEVTFKVRPVRKPITSDKDLDIDHLINVFDEFTEAIILDDAHQVKPVFVDDLYFKLNGDAVSMMYYLDDADATKMLEQVAWEFLANTDSVKFVEE